MTGNDTATVTIDFRGEDLVLEEIPFEYYVHYDSGARYSRNGDPGESGSTEFDTTLEMKPDDVKEAVEGLLGKYLVWAAKEPWDTWKKISDAVYDLMRSRLSDYAG